MDLLQPLLAVAVVLSMLCGALYLLKSRGLAAFRLTRGSSTGTGSLQVLEHVALTPQHALHLVRVGDRSVVVATAPSSCQIICDLPSSLPKQS